MCTDHYTMYVNGACYRWCIEDIELNIVSSTARHATYSSSYSLVHPVTLVPHVIMRVTRMLQCMSCKSQIRDVWSTRLIITLNLRSYIRRRTSQSKHCPPPSTRCECSGSAKLGHFAPYSFRHSSEQFTISGLRINSAAFHAVKTHSAWLRRQSLVVFRFSEQL